MKLVVLGANGRTGKLVLQVALDRGMDVTAVVRSAGKQPCTRHDRLISRVGDPCNPTFLKSVLPGHDVVISALGGRSPTKMATSVYCRSASAIVEAACDTGLNRVLVTSTALLFPPRTLPERILQFVVPNVVRSATRMEEILKESDLNWTFARCGFLNDDEEAKYRAQKDSLPSKGTSVSRLALAHFLVDATENSDARCSVFGVSNPKT